MPNRFVGNIKQENVELFLSDAFTYEMFSEAAVKNGWNKEGDDVILRNIYDGFVARKNQVAFSHDPRKMYDYQRKIINAIDDIYSYALTPETTHNSPYSRKKLILFDAKEALSTLNYYDTLNDIYKNQDNDLNTNSAIEEYRDKRKSIFNDIDDSYSQKSECDILKAAYDAYLDKNGHVLVDMHKIVTNNAIRDFSKDPEEADREKQLVFQELKKAIEDIDEDLRTDEQNKILDDINKELDPFTKEQREWAKKTGRRELGYYQADNWLAEVYALKRLDEVRNNPNHPINKAIKELEEGKVSEFPHVKMGYNGSFNNLITDTIHTKIRKALNDMPASPEKNSAINALDKYDQVAKEKKKWIQIEKIYAPYAECYDKITPAGQKKIGELADALEKDKNIQGSGESELFTEMINKMKAFSKVKALFGGHDFRQKMVEMDDAILAFNESETKAFPENPNPNLALMAMDQVNPAKAVELRQTFAKNLFASLSDTKKKWYDNLGRDTTEYTNFKNALEAFSNLKISDEGYENAANTLATEAKNYIERKSGGLSVEASNDRRKLAVLALSLVKPEEALNMVKAANKDREKNKLETIDLNKLTEKVNTQAEKRAAKAEEAEKKLTKNGVKRKKRKAKQELMNKLYGPKGEEKDPTQIAPPTLNGPKLP